MKHTGKPSAGKLHAGFDAAGTGTQLTVWLVRHSQRKRRATARPNLRSMAPVLDPTTSPWPCNGTFFVATCLSTVPVIDRKRNPQPQHPRRDTTKLQNMWKGSG